MPYISLTAPYKPNPKLEMPAVLPYNCSPMNRQSLVRDELNLLVMPALNDRHTLYVEATHSLLSGQFKLWDWLLCCLRLVKRKSESYQISSSKS